MNAMFDSGKMDLAFARAAESLSTHSHRGSLLNIGRRKRTLDPVPQAKSATVELGVTWLANCFASSADRDRWSCRSRSVSQSTSFVFMRVFDSLRESHSEKTHYSPTYLTPSALLHSRSKLQRRCEGSGWRERHSPLNLATMGVNTSLTQSFSLERADSPEMTIPFAW